MSSLENASTESLRPRALRRFYQLLAKREEYQDGSFRMDTTQEQQVGRLRIVESLTDYFTEFEDISGMKLHDGAKFIFSLIHTMSGGFMVELKNTQGDVVPVIYFKNRREDILDHELEHLIDSLQGPIETENVNRGKTFAGVATLSLGTLGISSIVELIAFVHDAFRTLGGEKNISQDPHVFLLAIVALSLASLITSSTLYERLPHERSANRNKRE